MTKIHIVLMVILMICMFLGYIGKELNSDKLCIIAFTLILTCFVAGGIIHNIPKIKYQQLILNCEKAENNLEKFYKKHPEFKEVEEENE